MSILNNSFHTKQNPVFTGLKFGFGSTSTSDTEVGPIPYWIATLGGTSNDYGQGIALDDSGNVYVCGQTPGDINDALVSKYNNSGVLQWQRTQNSTGLNDYAYGITADNDGVYVVGTTFRDSDGRGYKSKIHVSKINSAGVYQWSKIYDYNSNYGGLSEYFVRSEGKAIVEDSYYLYVTGRLDTDVTGTNQNIFVMRINKSNGNVLWFNTLGISYHGGESIGRAIEIKNSNLYISGDYKTGEDGYVAKLNPINGSLTWQRSIISSANDAEAHGVAVDSSDNVFVSGQNDDYLFVIKYNSSGDGLWYRKIYDSSATFMSAREIAVDSLDNIYIVGHSVISGSTDILIVKLNNSDGTIQWQRTLGGTSTADIGKGIKIDSSDNLYIVGHTNTDGAGGSDLLIARLPSDGTLEDTYGNFTYQQSSFSESATTAMTFDDNPDYFVEDPNDISDDSLDVTNSNFTITVSSLTSETTELD